MTHLAESPIQVQRKVWRSHIGAPRTQAREAGVYVIGVLRKIIAKYESVYPPIGEGWMFRGEKLLRPLNLDNLSRRDMPHFIPGQWLGTRLNEAGVDEKDIQSILRHADVGTT
jgi:hypothetical protein